ncbi:hypothetical protein [Microbacterium sp. cf332]|uniref:hypothetical protein n=1 Tax=Microbacterium sp. cf332 TaxID=1761804 RepID=UPI000890FDCC|nr:hypothetical protein [Microbacterium sp. cf332]SDQ27510.1 hypothetical protein SAMN04487847_1193 [Microbacterium sp. cf332]
MPSPRQQRSLRAGAAASLATFVALLSHVAAGGAPPSVLGVLLPWALSLLIALLIVGRRLSLARLGTAVATAQVVFHAMFALGVVPSAGSAGSATVTGGGHAAHNLFAAHMSLSASVASPAGFSAVVPDAAMLAAHVVAAVLTTLVLHRGEHLVAGLGALAQRIAVRIRAVARDVVPPVRTPTRARSGAGEVRVRHPRPLVAAPARRGPPVLLAF